MLLALATALATASFADAQESSSLQVADIRVRAIRKVGGQRVADVPPFELRVGSRLADGSVTAVADDYLIVRTYVRIRGEPTDRFLLFAPRHPVPPILTSHETTWITSPLLADGTPDYGRWLNQKYGAGIVPENNAAPLLERGFAGMRNTGKTFWDGTTFLGDALPDVYRQTTRMFSRPWVDADCPTCVGRLDENARPLQVIAQAVRRPHYFTPSLVGMRIYDQPMRSLLSDRKTANALAGRGMLSVGRGELRSALDDAVTAHRLGMLLGQGPTLMERLIGNAVRGVGVPLLAKVGTAPGLSPEDAKRLLGELQAPLSRHDLADTFNDHERLLALDRILLMRERFAASGAGTTLDLLEPETLRESGLPSDLPPVVYLLPVGSVDWDEALRLTNRKLDLIVKLMRATTAAERGAADAALTAEWSELDRKRQIVAGYLTGDPARAPSEVVATAERVGRTPEGPKQLSHLFIGSLSLTSVRSSVYETEAQSRLALLAVALVVHRNQTGAFPARLEDLAPGLLSGRSAGPAPGYRIQYSRGNAAGRFALTAMPEEMSVTGYRGFCIDSTGTARATIDGTIPPVDDGSCVRAPLLH